jgi:hypothetical protein
MKNPLPHPPIKVTVGKGGVAGIPLADKDRARGLTPGVPSGTAGLRPGDRKAVAAAAKAVRAAK